MSPIRLITFDMTNTMIRVLGSVGQNYANVAAQYGKTVDPTKIDSAFKRQFKLQMAKYPNFGVKSGLTPFKWWTSLVIECFKDAGYDDPSLTQIANHSYVHFATAKGWEVIPGTASVLDHLKDKGLKLGVVSNFDNRLEKILHELSLAHYFDFIVDSATFGEAKPSREIFDHALKAGKTEASDALHIGDNSTNDYHGAINAGMKALLLVDSGSTIHDSVNKDHVIQRLGEVERYINDNVS
ncbi:MAG: HAD-IA family hydrolase [Candidatus Thiodiazotropha sp.]